MSCRSTRILVNCGCCPDSDTVSICELIIGLQAQPELPVGAQVPYILPDGTCGRAQVVGGSFDLCAAVSVRPLGGQGVAGVTEFFGADCLRHVLPQATPAFNLCTALDMLAAGSQGVPNVDRYVGPDCLTHLLPALPTPFNFCEAVAGRPLAAQGVPGVTEFLGGDCQRHILPSAPTPFNLCTTLSTLSAGGQGVASVDSYVGADCLTHLLPAVPPTFNLCTTIAALPSGASGVPGVSKYVGDDCQLHILPPSGGTVAGQNALNSTVAPGFIELGGELLHQTTVILHDWPLVWNGGDGTSTSSMTQATAAWDISSANSVVPEDTKFSLSPQLVTARYRNNATSLLSGLSANSIICDLFHTNPTHTSELSLTANSSFSKFSDASGEANVTLTNLKGRVQYTPIANPFSVALVEVRGFTVELNTINDPAQVGLGTYTGLVKLTAYPNTRNESLAFVPSNFLYTDVNGVIRSAPSSAMPPPAETPITPVDTSTIDLSVSGAANHTLQGIVKISATAGNAVTALADGLFVSIAGGETPLVATDTATFDFTTSGTAGHNLTGSVRVSANAGNVLTAVPDGLYVPTPGTFNLCTSISGLPVGATDGSSYVGADCQIHALPAVPGETPITANDSSSIDITASGASNHTLVASVIISPNAGNVLTNPGNGLFVPTPPSGTALTVVDTSSIDFSTSGVDQHTLTGVVKVSATAGNQVTINADGIYVPAAAAPAAGGSPTQVQYNAAGVLGGITGITSNGADLIAAANNLKATSPQITTGINESFGNPMLLFSPNNLAVNQLTIANAIAGSPPSLTVTGSDANINVRVDVKGTANLLSNALNFDLQQVSSSTALRVAGGVHPGGAGGLLFTFSGGSQSNGPGIYWTSNAYGSTSGLWLNFGLNWQGANSSHSPFKIRKGTGTSADGAIVFNLYPDNGTIELFPFGVSAGNTSSLVFYELAANGTNTVSLRAPDALTGNPILVLPANAAPTVNDYLAAITVAGSVITTDWRTLPAGAGVAGSNKQVQFNNAGAFGGATGFEYQSGASPTVLVAAQNATYVAVRINSATTPSAPPFEVSADAGITVHFLITNAGAPSAPGSGTNSERFGAGSALSNATSSIALGQTAQMVIGGSNGVVIGQGATLAGANGVLIGQAGFASAANSVSIGQNISGAASGITFGKDASGQTNTFVAGSSGTPMNDVFFGKGVQNATPTAYTIHGTNSVGANIAGAALQLAGGIPTGTGLPGQIVFQLAGASATPSSAPNNLAAVLTLDAAVANAVGLKITGNAAAAGVKLEAFGGGTNEAIIYSVKGAASHTFIYDTASIANNTWVLGSTGTWAGSSNAGGIKIQLVVVNTVPSLRLASDTPLQWNSANSLGSGSIDTQLRRAAAANLAQGGSDVDTGVIAQISSVQNALAGGTADVPGANRIIAGSQSKGNQPGGSIIFQTSPLGSSGIAVNPLVTQVTINAAGQTIHAVGSVSAPTVTWAGALTTGIYSRSGNLITFTVSGVNQIEFTNNVFQMGISEAFGWTNGVAGGAANDTGAVRQAAAVWRFTNGSTGSGSIVLGTSTVGSVGTNGVSVLVLANGTIPTTSPLDETQYYSADSAAGDSNAFIRNEIGAINRVSGLGFRVATQFDATTTTLANIPLDRTCNVEAGRSYAFTLVLYTTSNIAGGVKVAIGGTATATSVIYEAEDKDGSSVVATGTARSTTLGTPVGDVTAVTTARIIVTGTIVVNASGTLSPQFACNAAVGTSSVLINSSFILSAIN